MADDAFTDALYARGLHVPFLHAESIDSTNAWAERELAQGRHTPFVLLADTQNAGVGQRGHQFDSPAGTGMYCTYVLSATPEQMMLLMPAAGVAASRACAIVSGTTPRLKWVNDLLVGRNKISGILAWIRQDRAGHPVAVLGWGLNLALPANRPLVANQPVAGLWDVAPNPDPRPALLANFLTELTTLLDTPVTIMPAYRRLAAGIGWRVHIDDGQRQLDGTLAGFADNGNAIVKTSTGTVTIAHGTLRYEQL